MLKDLECVARYEESLQALDEAPICVSLNVQPPTLQQIQEVQASMMNLPQCETDTKHHWATGLYSRQFTMPANALVVGKLHRHDHFILLVSGCCTVYTDQDVLYMEAPQMWVSQPGVKRIVQTHDEPAVFVTVHTNPDNLTDIQALEDIYIVEGQ
jgi:hypothetical protein